MVIKKRYIIIPLILILVSGSLFYWQKSTVPKLSEEGKAKALEKAMGRNLRQGLDTPATWKKYIGKNFEFEIPPRAIEYDLKKQQIEKNTNLIERYSFDSDPPRMIFVATVSDATKMQVKSLSDIPSVTMRQAKIDEYKKYSITIDNNDAIAFNKLVKDYEGTVFMLKDNKVYTFSLSSEYESDSLGEIFDRMMKSVVIK